MMMKNLKHYLILAFILVFIHKLSFAQSNPDREQRIKSDDELFGQFSLGAALGSDAYSVPKVAIKTYKFSALIGNAEWDFNLYNSVPAISINSGDSERYVRNDLIRQMGGILNVSLGRTGYFANGKIADLKEVKGGRFEFRIGAKAIDILSGKNQDRQLIPVLQSTLDLRYMIPLFEKKNKKDSTLTEHEQQNMVGNLTFRFIGGLLMVPGSTAFDEMYTTRKGIPPDPTVLIGSFDVYFFVTNQIYINLGYAFTNQDIIKPIPFFAISYGKSSN